MGEFFNLDNKFFQALGKLIDCIVVSILWLFCCVPVITTFYVAWQSATVPGWLICWAVSFLAGPATTALYYTINKVIRHGRSYIWKEYWHSFRANFKQSAAAMLILFGICLFMGTDCYIMYQMAAAGQRGGKLYIVFVVFIALLLVWGTYLFAYIARFENTVKQSFKNAALIAIANLPWSLLLLVLLVATALLTWFMPPLGIILPAGFMFAVNLILEKIFRKYMSKEDIAAEKERNQEFYN